MHTVTDLAVASCNTLHPGFSEEPAHQCSDAEREAKLDVFAEVGTEIATVQSIRHLKLSGRQLHHRLTTTIIGYQCRHTV